MKNCKYYDMDNKEIKVNEFVEDVNTKANFKYLAAASYIKDWNRSKERANILNLFFEKHKQLLNANYECHEIKAGVYVIVENEYNMENPIRCYAFVPDASPLSNTLNMYTHSYSTFDAAVIVALAYANYNEEDDFQKYIPAIFNLMNIQSL